MSDEKTPGQARAEKRFALLAGPARGLDLFERVPELFRSRDWPLDPDLQAVIISAVGLTKIGAGATPLYRPPTADGMRGAWPGDLEHTARCQYTAAAKGLMLGQEMTCRPHGQCISARELVAKLELQELLQNK